MERIKNLDNCLCFRELIIISAKNNENAIYIINIWPPKFTQKVPNFFFTEIQFNIKCTECTGYVEKITTVNQLITQFLEVYAKNCGSDC